MQLPALCTRSAMLGTSRLLHMNVCDSRGKCDCGTCHMASTFTPHSRTATATICSTSSLLLLGFTLSRSFHFYCCKRLFGRKSRLQQPVHLSKGVSTFSGVLYYSPAVWRTCDSSSASSYRLCWSLHVNWLALAKTYHHDIATVNLEFIFTT